MKKNLKYTIPALLPIVAVAYMAISFVWEAKNEGQEQAVLRLVHDAVSGGHYQSVEVNDAYSEEVMEAFMDSYDGEKRFIQQEDVNRLMAYELRLDDMLEDSDLTFFNLSQEIWQKRFQEAQGLYRDIL